MAPSLNAIRTAAPVAREIVEGRPLQQMQEVALRSTGALNAFPLQPGVLLTFVFDGIKTTSVVHGLGRVPRGWIVVDQLVFNAFNRVSWDDGKLELMGFSADTVKVWVF